MTEKTLSEKAGEIEASLSDLANAFETAEENGVELPNAEGKLNAIGELVDKLSEEVSEALDDEGGDNDDDAE